MALAALAAYGCTFLRPLDDLEPGPPGVAGAAGAAGAGAGGASGASGGGASGVSGASGGGASGASGGGACPPDMAPARFADGAPFCIDKLEASQADYAAFLQDLAGGEPPPRVEFPDGFPFDCEGNESYDPAAGPGGEACLALFRPAEAGGRPVTCVDFCDAAAYCAWKGKRLCGRKGGGPLSEKPAPMASLPEYDEWFVACAGPAEPLRPFPYGEYAESVCNIDRPLEGAEDVGSRPGCRTDAGVFDLSGNVAEWTYACTADGASPTPRCLVRGGSYRSAVPLGAACTLPPPTPETGPQSRTALYEERRVDLGIRCCAD